MVAKAFGFNDFRAESSWEQGAGGRESGPLSYHALLRAACSLPFRRKSSPRRRFCAIRLESTPKPRISCSKGVAWQIRVRPPSLWDEGRAGGAVVAAPAAPGPPPPP